MSHTWRTCSARSELKLENRAKNQVDEYMGADTPTDDECACSPGKWRRSNRSNCKEKAT